MPSTTVKVLQEFMQRSAPDEGIPLGRGQKFAAFLSDYPQATVHEIQDSATDDGQIDIIVDLGSGQPDGDRFCRVDPSTIIAGLAFSKVRSPDQVTQFDKMCKTMQGQLSVANLSVRRHSSKTDFRF